MQPLFIDEPELEFNGGGRHIDIRYGLALYGALDLNLQTSPKLIRIGLIGCANDIDNMLSWIERCRSGVDGKSTRRRNLFPEFPGFGEGRPFCDFINEERLIDRISAREIRSIIDADTNNEFFMVSSNRYIEGAKDLIDKANADVVVCLLPEEFIRRIDMPEGKMSGARSGRKYNLIGRFIWHDAFKAAAFQLNRPLQLCRPATYGGGIHRYTRTGKADRNTQDEATRAWNFFCALYYKAGGIPWRLQRSSSDLTTCFAGISFYRDLGSDSIQTSVAQLFNERGEGVIVRGGPAVFDKNDRTPHLSGENIEDLLLKLMAVYKREHKNVPARIVCHKSSHFNTHELDGCRKAIDKMQIDSYDLLSLRISKKRFYRSGSYPPLRGTAINFDDSALLYTNGSIDFYQCYPGLYVPRALDVKYDHIEQSPRMLLNEILSLTKMNWNSTEMATLEPVTLDAARGVGSILRYAESGDMSLQSRFSFYM